MTDRLTRLLTQAAAHTLEGLCMSMPDEVTEPRRDGEPPRAAIEIGFSGPFSGSVVLRAYGSLLDEIASTMTAADGTVDDDTIGDALGEIANVVCGNLLPELVDAHLEFDVHPPMRIAPAAADSQSPSAAISLDFLDGRVECEVTLAHEALAKINGAHS